MNVPISLAVATAFVTGAMAQQVPGAPEENGLNPKSSTIYVNRRTAEINNINNGNTEALGVGIASGGNIIVGWEDDGEGVTDFETVWTLFDSAGTSLTPDTTATSVAPDVAGSVTTKFLSYFRANGSAVAGGHSWGPKIKANIFGDGIGMGAISWQMDVEEPSLAGYDGNNQGDYPLVQLLDNTGKPTKILGGVSEAFAVRDAASIRIGDWDYLSNGNVVISSDSRQKPDLVDVFGGTAPYNHVIYRVVDQSGKVIKAETLAAESPEQTADGSIWHGVGVTANGFAIRFQSGNGPVVVRLFDNTGNPTSTNINLAELTGKPEAGGGGRGDGAGFHGNGKDAYVAAHSTSTGVWVTVLNANGTVRYSKAVADDLTLSAVDRVDAAIDADGNVIVVFNAKYDSANANQMMMGCRLDSTGKAVGKTFYISEKELPDPAGPKAAHPRVAWRAGQAVVVWASMGDTETVNPDTAEVLPVVAMRIFSTFSPGTIESVGLTRIVADTPVVKTTDNALGNWEPYVGVLGTSTFLVECNTFADGTTDMQRYVVGLQPATGGAMKQVEGFYADNGQPFKGQINLSRQNGNPGRVAGDARPGATHYIVGGEASPHAITDFQSGNRWNLGFDRLADGRYGTIQIYDLNTSTLAPTPLCKAQDSAYGRATSGTTAGNQMSRFGGDVVGLDNGNFVSVVEDRARVLNPDSDCVVATIFAPDGSIVKEAFIVANGDIWANVAPCKGGFAVRAKPEDGSANRSIYFFDNVGTPKGSVDQATSGATFDTGRGDGTRLFGHINSPYVYLTGKAANTTIVKVVAFDSRDQKFAAIADVSEGGFSGDFDRASGAVDALNRLTVSWVVKPTGYAQQQVAARVLSFDGTAKKFTPITPSFFPFINTATNNIRSVGMTVAMTTKQICVAAKGEINYANQPAAGPDSPTEVNFFTVFTHPNPADDPTTPVGGGSAPALSITRSGTSVTIAWDASATGFTLESKASLTDATWTAVGTQNPTVVTIGAGPQFFRLRK
jgi:hypothetical protein